MTSVFKTIKEDICKEIMNTINFTELEEKLNYILNEWDLSEENRYYN